MNVVPPSDPQLPVSSEDRKDGHRPERATAPAAVREREIKLAAPPAFRLLDLGGIADGIVATSSGERRLLTVYWDTQDLRLIRWGCTLRHRAGEGWTVKLPDPGGGNGLLSRMEHTFPGPPTRPPEAALDLVRVYVRTAPVVPVARMRTVRRVVALHSADGQRLAEIDDDEVSVYDGRRVAARFREIEVEVDESAPTELVAAVVELLHAGGAGAVDSTPKLVRALGPRALEPPDVTIEDLRSRATAADLVRRALAASVVRLIRHDAGVRVGDDPEEVHQARVATRRLRSDLRSFQSLLDADWTSELRDELRWLGGELGSVRDIEVLQERLHAAGGELPASDKGAVERLVNGLGSSIRAARRHLLVAMRSDRYAALLDRLVDAARSPVITEAASARAHNVAREVVRGPWQKLRSAARRLDGSSTDEELHDLRIRAKRCRYAAEAVAPVVGRRATEFARAAAALQQVLGDLHDAVVAEAWLREHVARISSSGDIFVIGELCALQRVTSHQARVTWKHTWKQLARKELRSWM